MFIYGLIYRPPLKYVVKNVIWFLPREKMLHLAVYNKLHFWYQSAT